MKKIFLALTLSVLMIIASASMALAKPATGNIYTHTPIGMDFLLKFTEGDPGFINEQTAWVANVFTADKSSDLNAISFQCTNRDTDVKVYVVPEYTDENSLLDGSRIYKAEAHMETPGWHTIRFNDSPEAIEKGDKFAVILEIVALDVTAYPMAVEAYSEGATASPGQSFISADGGASGVETWLDLYQTLVWYDEEYQGAAIPPGPQANICLNAITTK